MPFIRAISMIPGIRHLGIEPDCFQLETVVGARSNSLATATVPPRASIMLETDCMNGSYDIRNALAIEKYDIGAGQPSIQPSAAVGVV